ncbi:hypothetical protein ZWY2020_035158 [Hordeum vulgare]|nr:hypothetical protein ZWY2020_035158 [Hordeum vulgare]
MSLLSLVALYTATSSPASIALASLAGPFPPSPPRYRHWPSSSQLSSPDTGKATICPHLPETRHDVSQAPPPPSFPPSILPKRMIAWEEVSQGQQMDGFVKEKAARESGDGRKIKTSPSINLNSLPTMAPAPVEIVVLHGAMESGANDAESSGTDKKKPAKNEEVDEGKIQAHADMKSDSVDPLNNENHAGEKDALVSVLENEGCADSGIIIYAQVLSVVKKDEPEKIVDYMNRVTVAEYREEKGAAGSTSAIIKQSST